MSNFFKININSNKLFTYLQGLESQLLSVSNQVSTHTGKISNLERFSRSRKTSNKYQLKPQQQFNENKENKCKSDNPDDEHEQRLMKIEDLLIDLQNKLSQNQNGKEQFHTTFKIEFLTILKQMEKKWESNSATLSKRVKSLEKVIEGNSEEIMRLVGDVNFSQIYDRIDNIEKCIYQNQQKIKSLSIEVGEKEKENNSRIDHLKNTLREYEEEVKELGQKIHEEGEVILLKVESMMKSTHNNKAQRANTQRGDIWIRDEWQGRSQNNEPKKPTDEKEKANRYRVISPSTILTWAKISNKVTEMENKIERDIKYPIENKIMFSGLTERSINKLDKQKYHDNEKHVEMREINLGDILHKQSSISEKRRGSCLAKRDLSGRKQRCLKKQSIMKHEVEVEEEIKISQKTIRQIEKQVSRKNQIKYEELKEQATKTINQMKNTIKETKEKMITIEEKMGINSRKIDREAHKLEELKYELMKKFETKTVDQKIENVENRLKMANTELFLKVQKKLDRETFEKEKITSRELIQKIQDSFLDFAVKGEMQQAFFFLEEKMKELIYYIVREQTNERTAVINKVPLKCLICDKQTTVESTSNSNTPNLNTVSRKIYTKNLRRKGSKLTQPNQ